VPESLFVFIQMEFPWRLGPPDGRYLMRDEAGGEPRHVLVLGTLGEDGRQLPPSPWPRRRLRRRKRGGGRVIAPEPEAAVAPTTKATVIDPVPLAAEQQARAWLAELDRERDVLAATAVINRALHLHRIASADPYLHEVSPAQALVIRAGWGSGEQVADGHWLHARELPFHPRRPGRGRRAGGERSAALRPQERFAALLGGRTKGLLCEEHALRARLDLDHGRSASAALELEHAYATGLGELRAEERHDLALRLDELDQLSGGVAEQARLALSAPDALDEDVLTHALERLEAALRARTATGFSLR
jgi:hypothetical protein